MSNFNYKDYIQDHLLNINGYKSLTYPKELSDFIKLDGNENPYGPSNKVTDALSNRNDYQLYPNSIDELKQTIADYLNVQPSNIVCGAGADAVINLIFSSLKNNYDDMQLATITPTFGMYKHDAMINNIDIDELEQEINYRPNGYYFDVDAEPQIALIFASPNNPTGQIMEKDSMLKLLDKGHMVIIDEAYIKFSQYQSYVELTKEYSNLIVIQTFSKWAGLAGLRIGYGIMNEELASTLNAIQQPYTITNYAMEAAIISLNDTEYLNDNVKKIIETRNNFINQLVDITNITPIPSEGNFVLCHLNKGANTDFHKFMYDKKILIRIYSDAILAKYARISIGTTDNMQKVLNAIEEWDKK
ncbi:MAG: histidinol-phosphate transaminase [Dehalococcoidia bacterium]|nr:histidinol-phosphate transaminase [Dehalococcoidia bacterium]